VRTGSASALAGLSGQGAPVLSARGGGACIAAFRRQGCEVKGYNNGRQAVVGPKVGSRLTVMFWDGQVSGSKRPPTDGFQRKLPPDA